MAFHHLFSPTSCWEKEKVFTGLHRVNVTKSISFLHSAAGTGNQPEPHLHSTGGCHKSLVCFFQVFQNTRTAAGFGAGRSGHVRRASCRMLAPFDGHMGLGSRSLTSRTRFINNDSQNTAGHMLPHSGRVDTAERGSRAVSFVSCVSGQNCGGEWEMVQDL